MPATINAPPSAKKLLSAEEFFDFVQRPENADTHFELDAGEVVAMPPPGELHGLVCWLIAYSLSQYVMDRKKGFILTNDSGLIVKNNPTTIRGADIMFFAESKPYSAMSLKYTESTPQLVVEVISPNDKPGKLLKRIRQYHERGVPLVWVVYPEERIVNVHKVNELPLVLEETDTLDGGVELPGFASLVSQLFILPGTAPAPEGAPQP